MTRSNDAAEAGWLFAASSFACLLIVIALDSTPVVWLLLLPSVALVALFCWRGRAWIVRKKNDRMSLIVRDSLSSKATGLLAFEALAQLVGRNEPELGWIELHPDRGTFHTLNECTYDFELNLAELRANHGQDSITLEHYDEAGGTVGDPVLTLHSPGIRYTGLEGNLQRVYGPALSAIHDLALDLACEREIRAETAEHERLLRLERTRGVMPAARLVRDAAEAEELAAEWTRWLGWPGAYRTVATGDSGIDVYGESITNGIVVAQVKFEALPAGRPVLQAIFGAGHGVGAQAWLFFTSAGYTAQAVAWADGVDMALFRFTLDGQIEPSNRMGEALLRG